MVDVRHGLGVLDSRGRLVPVQLLDVTDPLLHHLQEEKEKLEKEKEKEKEK